MSIRVSDFRFRTQRKWDSVRRFLFPRSLFTGTSWLPLWNEEERQVVKRRYQLAAPTLSAAYVLHFFLVDTPAGAQPNLRTWAIYRFSVAAAYLLVFLYSFTNSFTNHRGYRVPLILATVLSSYFLAHSMLWDPRMPFYLAVVLPIFFVWFLYLPSSSSVALLGGIYAMQFPVLYRVLGPVSDRQSQILSPFIVGLLFIAVIRSSFSRDVLAFIQHQRLLEERQRTIEIYSQLMEQTKAFAPREIFNRILSIHHGQEKTILEATKEVLMPREAFVTCIYSDVRNHTAQSAEHGYLNQRLVPNIQKLTEIAEDFQGIPRLIGDLIFVYFDLEARHALLNAFSCAAQFAEENRKMGALSKTGALKRHLILSAGVATVGNIGGNNSAREVTCLGTPANIVARIDELTKVPRFLDAAGSADIILTQAYATSLQNTFPSIPLVRMDLPSLNLNIRSFPEETVLYLFHVNVGSLSVLEALHQTEFSLPDKAA